MTQGRSIQSFLSGGSRLNFSARRQESQEATPTRARAGMEKMTVRRTTASGGNVWDITANVPGAENLDDRYWERPDIAALTRSMPAFASSLSGSLSCAPR